MHDDEILKTYAKKDIQYAGDNAMYIILISTACVSQHQSKYISYQVNQDKYI